MKYLLECNGLATFVEMQGNDSSDYYGATQRAFQKAAGCERDRFAYVSMTRMDDPETACGVPFTWSLAGSAGAAFELIALPAVTSGQIDDAKNKLRRDRDAVSLHVRRISALIPFTQPPRAE